MYGKADKAIRRRAAKLGWKAHISTVTALTDGSIRIGIEAVQIEPPRPVVAMMPRPTYDTIKNWEALKHQADVVGGVLHKTTGRRYRMVFTNVVELKS